MSDWDDETTSDDARVSERRRYVRLTVVREYTLAELTPALTKASHDEC